MRTLTRDEMSAVSGGDGDSCEAVAAATTTIVSSTVAHYAAPMTWGGSLLLGLGSAVVYQTSGDLCEYITTPDYGSSYYSLGPIPLPTWMMYELPWVTGEGT